MLTVWAPVSSAWFASDGIYPVGPQDCKKVMRTPHPTPHLRGFTDSLSLPPEELCTSSHVKWGGARGGGGNAHESVFMQVSGALGKHLRITSMCPDSLSSFWYKDRKNTFSFLNSAFFSP